MTDETRAELRRGLTELVTWAMCDNGERTLEVSRGHSRQSRRVEVFKRDESVDPPPLTAAQQLALSVLLDEPDSVIASALADMLLDAGHEYATAVAEKARSEGVEEERGRCADIVQQARQYMQTMTGNDLIDAVLSGRAPNPKMFFRSASHHIRGGS